ncbi:aconitate hydratase AcnA [Anaerotalea alkaliphila]|uniref:Aconitate hydratase n=1 Tax=Anaerotalea alkaliphila TaxID=2662126 RepID=A0A7X5HUN0_9FIRM|nr:aconitate hydratase AcnA [Anaerotalea alkaliphila]NDL66945.1 aconitate hydratase AcnA [Anaerotalea alkaliphila]
MSFQPESVKKTLQVGDRSFTYFSLDSFEKASGAPIRALPFSMKVLLEAAIRQMDGLGITQAHVDEIANWTVLKEKTKEIPFIPARIVLQDFTGVPVVVDLAAMRSTMEEMGGDPKKINPIVPVDLVIDHSVMVDRYGSNEALEFNVAKEFERNEERYRFLRWAQTAFDNFRAVPPATGIIHQVNLEYLASVATTKQVGEETHVYPDSLVGTDSHTTMINGLGVLGWGVGGIEAEAGMLGQPLYFLMPEVIGVKLTGSLPEGTTATDLALTVTNMLRKKGVVGKFVEYFGEGVFSMNLADRATVANMSPEYGATMGFFPVDQETLHYLRETGRDEEQVALVEAYYKAQGMFAEKGSPEPQYSEVLELDLSTVVPSLAGPKRPQDLVLLSDMKESFRSIAAKPLSEGGYGLSSNKMEEQVEVQWEDGRKEVMKAGAVVLAAITSCTNTSNPSVMIGSGLVAKKAVELGLSVPSYVKTSLTPGSLVVKDYLDASGVMPYLEKLGFHSVGYGCATCIGNSGPLPGPVSSAITENDMTVASVLSGNRNFEGRIHAQIKMNYLASPMLVVAYALAGTVDIDFAVEPIGTGKDGQAVYLKDIWPSSRELQEAVAQGVQSRMFINQYKGEKNVFTANERWNSIAVPEGDLYEWDADSTYIQEPPFFKSLSAEPQALESIRKAHILAMLGDSVTTDHISPAGSIAPTSPAGTYLTERGIAPADFNSYGSRRGNHEVMMRGTFANIRIRNEVAPGTEGGVTKHFPEGDVLPIYDASMAYQEQGADLVVVAGKEYGTGSSRDWAAKGTLLLGVKAVLAESYERIHRSNLVGMGVLPLQFKEGENRKTLGLVGDETITIEGLEGELLPMQELTVKVEKGDGTVRECKVVSRLDSLVDVEYYKNQGILQTVLRQLMK